MIPYPNLSGTVDNQLLQLKSYLYQVADQLNYSFENEETRSQALREETVLQVEESVSPALDSVKSMIIKTADEIKVNTQKEVETLSGRIEAVSEEFGTFVGEYDATITKTEERFTDVFNRIETVNGQIYNYNTYIITGHLFDIDGKSYDGIAIGTNLAPDADDNIVGDTLIAITPDELSVWRNRVKIGYFTGDRFKVTARIDIGDWSIRNDNNYLTIK